MIFAANWKLNKTPQEVEDFFSTFLSSDLLKNSLTGKNEIIFFPQALLAGSLSKIFNQFRVNNKNILSWGLQDTFYSEQGAFTGENSAATMKKMGGQFTLVGHSERRTLFNETSDIVAKKIQLLQKLDIVPLLCCGEPLRLRESGQYKKFILKQLEESLALCDLNKRIILAYEPVWAIGTGKQALPKDIKEVGELIKEKYPKLELLYGGSVKPSNVSSIISESCVGGVLVGGASLDPSIFLELLK